MARVQRFIAASDAPNTAAPIGGSTAFTDEMFTIAAPGC